MAYFLQLSFLLLNIALSFHLFSCIYNGMPSSLDTHNAVWCIVQSAFCGTVGRKGDLSMFHAFAKLNLLVMFLHQDHFALLICCHANLFGNQTLYIVMYTAHRFQGMFCSICFTTIISPTRN